MLEEVGNLWTKTGPDSMIVIPTNYMVRKDGSAVMGAGVAKDAALRFPELPLLLGQKLKDDRMSGLEPPSCHIFHKFGVVAFPTKLHWKCRSSLKLIEASCQDLYLLGIQNPARTFYLPKVGCGLGGLNWHTEVRPLLAAKLPEDQFVVVLDKPT